ncbi:MAG: hypothetical protein IJ489_08625 [Clostridia bacterium]|nr:hypothetical protein [Clostridia bacterium]
MKKFLCLFLLLSLILLTACTNNIADDTTVSEPTETTEKSSYPVDVYYTESGSARPIQSESPELQEKIDANQAEFPYIPNKVVVEIGGKRDVPYVQATSPMGYYKNENSVPTADPPYNGIIMIKPEFLLEHCERMPVYQVKNGDAFIKYINEKPFRDSPIFVFDFDADAEMLDYRIFSTIDALCEELGSGIYYAFVDGTCYGDNIMKNSNFIMQESTSIRAYFILEIE